MTSKKNLKQKDDRGDTCVFSEAGHQYGSISGTLGERSSDMEGDIGGDIGRNVSGDFGGNLDGEKCYVCGRERGNKFVRTTMRLFNAIFFSKFFSFHG